MCGLTIKKKDERESLARQYFRCRSIKWHNFAAHPCILRRRGSRFYLFAMCPGCRDAQAFLSPRSRLLTHISPTLENSPEREYLSSVKKLPGTDAPAIQKTANNL
jgi:hypothetical protein